MRANVLYKKVTQPLDKKRFIHDVIANAFSEAELRVLVFKIAETERFKSHGRIDEIAGMTYDNLPGEGKVYTALELVLFMRRHGRYSDLIKWLESERKSVDWQEFNKKL